MADEAKPKEYDPDDYRMSVGDHLDELRSRLIRGLFGLLIALGFCLWFGSDLLIFFCRPLLDAQVQYGLSQQIHYTQMSDPFMVFIRIALVCALAFSSPWLMFQLWMFVAAGLYRHERRIVLRYIPLSLTLLVVGMVFVYMMVLPLALSFFFGFSLDLGQINESAPTTQPVVDTFQVPTYDGDPPQPTPGQIWISNGQLRVFINDEVRSLNLAQNNLMQPIITLPEYIALVFGMLLVFGLSFQLPLVVLALARVGIVQIEVLRAARRYVYFALAIIAAVITPGDVFAATLALMVPLFLLYELGIWMAARAKPIEPDEGDMDE